MPPSSTGFSCARPSSVVSRRPWSRVTSARSDVGCFCSSSTGASIGLISRSNRPSAQACLALRCDSKPNWSMSSRVMPRRLAIRSAAVNWSGRSMSHDSGRRMLRGRDRRWRPARRGSSPRCRTRCRCRWRPPRSARRSGGWPAGRCRTGSRRWWRRRARADPATSQPTRVMLLDCSPNCVTQPPMICSTSPASMPAFSTRAFCTAPSSSVACRPDNHPFRLPIGLRVASTMTGLPIPPG